VQFHKLFSARTSLVSSTSNSAWALPGCGANIRGCLLLHVTLYNSY